MRIFKWKVLVTTNNKSYLFRKTEVFFSGLYSEDILYTHASMLDNIEIETVDGDYEKISDKCVDNLYDNIYKLDSLHRFFPNIEDLSKKIKLSVFQYFDGISYEQQMIIQWLENTIYKDSFIVNCAPMRFGAKCIWSHSDLKVIFVLNYIFFSIHLITKIFLALTKKVVKSTNSLMQINKIHDNVGINPANSSSVKHDVLFFPHCGVVTMGHPPKDHFYSDNPSSPFYPSRIMHFEYDNRLDISEEVEKMKHFFKVDSVTYERIFSGNIPWYGAVQLLLKLFKNIKIFNYTSIGNNIIYIIIIFWEYIRFSQYRSAMRNHKNAKIALVGYDILFPKSLALALDSYGIKTIAIQERVRPLFVNCYSYNIHTQLVVSDFTANLLKHSNRFLVKHTLAVGQVRTDHFFDEAPSTVSVYKRRVILLDYHIDKHNKDEKFELILNLKNDIQYRNEVLSIAEANPDIEFIFRGKNCDWYSAQSHHQIIHKANKLPNVTVNTDYSNDHWASYHLCTSADLIIAKPTSLAEECVSAGMNVIVLDYGINHATIVSKFLPSLLKKYYCHSFEQLQDMFDFWKKNKYIISDKGKNKIKSDIFSNLTDGKVKQRVQRSLKVIYDNS